MQRDCTLEMQRQAQRGQGVHTARLESQSAGSGKREGESGCSICPWGATALAGTRLVFHSASLGREEFRAAKGLLLKPLDGKGPTGLQFSNGLGSLPLR